MPPKSQTAVFRVRGIPDTTSREQLERAITEDFQDDEKEIKTQLSITPSCASDGSQTALLEFTPRHPQYLDDVVNDPLGETSYMIEINPEACLDISIDMNFYGLTQLYPTTPGEKIVADIVAVTGLGGHAYGSWTNKKSQGNRPKRMWLRHFLSRDFPKCRAMVYGYDSKLQSNGIQQIIDYKRDFLAQLKEARKTEDEKMRPIIFIGHSFGGIIIAQSLLMARERDDEPVTHSVFTSTHAVMFFATPHRGLIADDILKVLNPETDADRIRLVNSINSNSDRLTEELRRFINLTRKLKVVSFYEQQKTKGLVKHENGSISRSGDRYTMLDNDSALLNLADSVEEKHPVNADHSDIVKFDNQANETYKHVCSYLRDYLEEFHSRSSQLPAGERRQLDTELLEAASNGDIAKLRTLLNRGASIKATDTGRQTALHLAASAGHEEAVKFLLKSGADKNARDSTDSIPARSAKIFGHPGLANMMERNLL